MRLLITIGLFLGVCLVIGLTVLTHGWVIIVPLIGFVVCMVGWLCWDFAGDFAKKVKR